MTNRSDNLPIRNIVIIGGGISGLSAAWFLEQAYADNSDSVKITVLEHSNRFGGKIRTDTMDGFGPTPFIVEAGPDSFLTQKPWALTLARSVGLTSQILGTNDKVRNIFVLNKGKAIKLPEGVLLVVPTKMWPFITSPLITLTGKLRMALDLILPAQRSKADESLGSFVRRRFGNEALDKIAEPLMAGIYNANADEQSILATFPKFRDIEREHGSLIRGMIAQKPRPKANAQPGPNREPMSMFVSFKNGTEDLVTALLQHLKSDLRLNASVTTISNAHLAPGRFTVTLSDGTALPADDVILTCSAKIAAQLVTDVSPGSVDSLNKIRYASTGTVALGFRTEAIKRPINGFGIVVPRGEKRPINAITVVSTKFSNRVPDGHTLLRVFFGGARSPETMDLSDDSLISMVREQLHELVGVEDTPLFTKIERWFGGNPLYDVHHLELCDTIDASLPDGIWITGCSYRGVGLPDCVHQSQQLIQRLVA